MVLPILISFGAKKENASIITNLLSGLAIHEN